MVVFPYQHTQESASAAVRIGLASLVPVACTPLPIFDDVASVTYRLSGITPEAVAEGVTNLLSDEALRTELAGKQKAWLAAHAWSTLSRRLLGLIRGEFVDRGLPVARALNQIFGAPSVVYIVPHTRSRSRPSATLSISVIC